MKVKKAEFLQIQKCGSVKILQVIGFHLVIVKRYIILIM